MSIYDFDSEIVTEQLTPPSLRKTKFLAWMKVLMRPLQWLRDLFFEDYCDGAVYADWVALSSYAVGDRITYTDNCNYECILANGGTPGTEPTGTSTSLDYWVKIQDNIIGLNQRVKFSSQIIILEHALNKWYGVPNVDPQIYIENNIVPYQFVMGNTGAYSSKMPNNSVFQEDYLGNVPDFSATDFTVWVPVALFATLGTTTQNRENNVKKFVNKYKLAGLTYNVDTY